jgi:hypothetical protein
MLSFGSSPSASTKNLVGLHINSASSAIDALRASGSSVRVIHPGTMVTRDFRPSRYNVSVDKDGNVTRVHMG